MEEKQKTRREAKRWGALIVAIVLFMFSLSNVGQTPTDIAETGDSFTPLLEGETVIQGSDSDKRIAVIPIYGVIESSTDSVWTQGDTYNHSHVVDTIDKISKDSSVAGVVLDINSPGGGVFESKEIYDRLTELKENYDIPIYASFGPMAASGGYYIGMAADKVYASEETMTGSIGVIMNHVNIMDLLDTLGIEETPIKSAKHKDIGSSTREMTEEEKKILQGYVDSAYNRFIDVVETGRPNLSREEILTLADGRIYDGVQATENGLVDELGYIDQVYADMADTIGSEDPQVFKYTPSDPFSLNQWLNSKTNSEVTIQKLIETYEAPRPMYLYGGEY